MSLDVERAMEAVQHQLPSYAPVIRAALARAERAEATNTRLREALDECVREMRAEGAWVEARLVEDVARAALAQDAEQETTDA